MQSSSCAFFYIYAVYFCLHIAEINCQLDIYCNSTELSCPTIVSNAIIEFTGGGKFSSPSGYDANVIPLPTSML